MGGYSLAMNRKNLLIAAVIAPSMLLAGCGTLGGILGTSAGPRDTRYVARDVNSLYLAAKSRMDAGQYRVAAALFDEVERQHPYSPWARRAQLMSAFNHYAAQQYTESTASAQRFLQLHPGNRDAPYAYYLISLNYYEQISDVTRDQHITQQALDSLSEVIRRYPDSEYASDARLKIDLVNDHLAGKEMDIGRYYQRSSRWLASAIRFRTVVNQYQTTSHAPEALYRLVESYLSLGARDEAVQAAAVLGRNYPGSQWYERAYGLINEHVPQAATVGN